MPSQLKEGSNDDFEKENSKQRENMILRKNMQHNLIVNHQAALAHQINLPNTPFENTGGRKRKKSVHEFTFNARELNCKTVKGHGIEVMAQSKRREQRQHSDGVYPILLSLQVQLIRAWFGYLGPENSYHCLTRKLSASSLSSSTATQWIYLNLGMGN